MPRVARPDAPGALHHVMIRGLEKREIFRDDVDRWDLLGRLCDLVPRWSGDCFGWVFMGNHAHFVLRTGTLPLAWLMRRLNTGYALQFNRRHERVGYLLQDRFKSRALRHFGVSTAELTRGARNDRVSRARAAIAFIGVARCRIPANRLARALGVSPQAISRAIDRGARIARDEGLDQPREET